MDTIKNPAGSKLTVDDLAGMLELWINDPSCRREIIKQFHYGLYHNVYLIARFAAQLALEKGADWAVDFSEAMERHDADTRRERYLYENFQPGLDVLQFRNSCGLWVQCYWIPDRDWASRAVEMVDKYRDLSIHPRMPYRIWRDSLGHNGKPIGVMYK